jgi:hypothetical protein
MPPEWLKTPENREVVANWAEKTDLRDLPFPRFRVENMRSFNRQNSSSVSEALESVRLLSAAQPSTTSRGSDLLDSHLCSQ